MADLKNYKANKDGWVAGRRVKKDDPLKLTERQTRYEDVRQDRSADREEAKAAKGAGVTETPKDKAK